MNTTIHLYGPLSIQTFGLMIVIGIFLVCWLMQKNPVYSRIMGTHHILDVAVVGTFIGVLGARMLYVVGAWEHLGSWTDIFKIWDEGSTGFSGTGAIVAIALLLPLYLRAQGIAALPFLDMLAIYTPILQMCVRIGCFFAGCCYGLPTQLPWGITYTNLEALAPLCVTLHPTQLYSAAVLFGIFLFLYFVVQHWHLKPGNVTLIYLVLAGIERFAVDFLRDDRELFDTPMASILSLQQWVAVGIIGVAGVVLLRNYCTKKVRS